MRTVLCLALAASACGDDDGVSCPADATFIADARQPAADAGPADPVCLGTPCGGDIVGTWDIVASCAYGTGEALEQCAASSITIEEFRVRGTFTFNADGTATTNADEDAHGFGRVPPDCLGVSDCPAVEALVEVGFAGSQLVCSPIGPVDECGQLTADENCECDFDLVNPAVQLNATYTLEGQSFTLTMGSEVIPGEYCVTGDELWLHALRFGGVDYNYRFRRAL